MLFLWLSFIPMSAIMIAGWWWQHRHQNAAIVDVLWAFLMGAFGLFYALTGIASLEIKILVAVLMVAWYWRIAWHLWSRLKREGEDGRYRYLREYWGKRASCYHFLFFQVQAGFAWGFTLPAWWLTHHVAPVSLWQIVLAVLLVAISWWGQSLADRQLAEFKQRSDTHGQVCREGLWRYSRHPNYFFEWLQWFVWPLLALQYDNGFWLLLAPAVMFLFLYFITGIPYTEQQAIRSRGDAYRDYQRTTSAFIPWRPK